MSREKVESYLHSVIDKGDPIFVIELYKDNLDLCTIPLKASLMLESL